MAMTGELGSAKTVVILSLVIGCFAVLWPKIFYPMLQASLSSSTNAPYTEVSGVYHSSILPCCHPVSFTKELNALYFTELCQRLQWRAGRRPDHQPPERGHELWTPGLARWCRDELRRTCGVQLDEAKLERYRRSGVDEADPATRNLTHCLETSYDVRRDEIRPSRQRPPSAAKFGAQERPSTAAPHAAAAAAHAQVQHMRRAPHLRTGDRPPPARAMPGMRPNVGGGYGGFVQQQPKGNGAMGIIMPIYTIGIVIFFIYTIMRVMLKRNDKSDRAYPEMGVRSAPTAPAPPATTTATTAATVANGRYRVQQDTADGRSRQPAPRDHARREPLVRRRVQGPANASVVAAEPLVRAAAATATASTPPARLRNSERLGDTGAAGVQEVNAAPAAAIPLPTKAEVDAARSVENKETEIDQLRRRLEDTERAMERIMKQMGSVSHKLNAAKISSNIRALKQELWGSVDSLASESCATDYSLDSRAQVLTDASLWTYSLGDSYGPASCVNTQSYGYTQSYGPSAYSVDASAQPGTARDAVSTSARGGAVDTAPLASAVSQLYRSVSQLSLELETAPPADDEVSLPAETGAELSELPDAEDEMDGVDELKHDGENAVRRFASLEALQRNRVATAVAERRDSALPEQGDGEQPPAQPAVAEKPGQVPSDSGDVDVKVGISEEGLHDLEVAIQESDLASASPQKSSPQQLVDAADKGSAEQIPAQTGDAGGDIGDAVLKAEKATPVEAAPAGPATTTGVPSADYRSSVSPPVSELRAATCPHSFPSGISSPSTESALVTPRVIVLGLRTKRTPEREPPRSISFRLGGQPGQELASFHADGRPPDSAVMIRETETRARRQRPSGGGEGDGDDRGEDAGLETKLELEVAGMEVTSAPPRSAWAARLHAATEASLASIEDDLKKAAQALRNVSRRVPGSSVGKETKKMAVSTPSDPAAAAAPVAAQASGTGSGVQDVPDSS